MSAVLLRAAAAKMRLDHPWDQPHLDGLFYSALADWLELQATRMDGASPSMVIDDHPALAVARAYLGESA